MRRSLCLIVMVLVLINSECKSEKYEANWESLGKHNEAPEWFRDAKLGIYFHWGVYSVPAFGSEWYPRNMHIKTDGVYKHHIDTYGEPSVFGYHDFIPMFKAEHFDAEEWVNLFKEAGAKFVGPVAEHHDGFSMWASKVNPWNVMEMGPKRDIVGEMSTAVRNNGLKLVTSFHHSFNNQHEIDGFPTGYYTPGEGWPTSSSDSKLKILYGNLPREEFLEMWKSKLKEVIDGYQPDMIWFDFALGDIPQETRQEFLAYYFNEADRLHKDVLVTCKGEDLPRDIAVEDFEKGRLDHLTDYPWLTDDTISNGSWCYTKNLNIKQADEVLTSFIDIVSKNGCLLLNVSPMADGTIPQNQRDVLLEVGEWLEVNGEAVYNTRPWKIYGQGPTKMGKSGHFVGDVKYNGKDIRFTQSKDGKTIYAICLGWPDEEVEIDSFNISSISKDASIQLLGNVGSVDYMVNKDRSLAISLPKLNENQRPCKYCYVFKLEGFEVEANLFSLGKAIKLTAEDATLDSSKMSLEDRKSGNKNIGMWDNPQDSIHWLIRIKEPGNYMVRGKFATVTGASNKYIDVNGTTLKFEVPSTGSWSESKTVSIGNLSFDRAGVYHLRLYSEKTLHKAINVWNIELAPMN